ncbi:hypothetical protein RJ641_009734 [Dillenia turbinata]|uniref:Uncharacterized protein n=1 Tax=Dillenia turbinata TaxID=194707 RepID=A0AAN8VD03_9MAGN
MSNKNQNHCRKRDTNEGMREQNMPEAGSVETLDVLCGLSPSNITVKSCGCLDRCGAGPNLVVLPDGVFIGHCSTAAKAAQVLKDFCGLSASEEASNSLAALALRKRAKDEFRKGNFSDSELLLTQAIDLKPFGGIHILHKNRLAMNNSTGAFEDAKEALQLAPQYTDAYICQGDAFMDMDHFDSAEKSYAWALEIDPSL